MSIERVKSVLVCGLQSWASAAKMLKATSSSDPSWICLFPLLADEGGQTRKDWGVPKDLLGLLEGRQTYVIGNILHQ